jgi:hypothetical protein
MAFLFVTQGERDLGARPVMANDLEEQIRSCQKRIEIVRTLIEEQWASGLSTEAAERLLAQELNHLRTLNERLAMGESNGDC